VLSPLRVVAAATAFVGISASCLAVGAAVTVGSRGTGRAPSSLSLDVSPAPAADAAVAWALARVGTPYRWGGVGPGGFDCSGLIQAAYGAAGVTLPRVAQQQFDAGPHVETGSPLRAGDLVFFGSSPTSVDHVGIALGQGDMVDAPHTGAVVRVEPIWSSGFLGATRPAG